MEQTTETDGAPLRIVEMTGEAGDVFLMHPNLLHAFSTNASDSVRMMLTQWIDARTAPRSD